MSLSLSILRRFRQRLLREVIRYADLGIDRNGLRSRGGCLLLFLFLF